MKAKELREMGEEELMQKKRDMSEELFNLRFQHATGQLENSTRIPKVKKDIARANTILREKKMQG